MESMSWEHLENGPESCGKPISIIFLCLSLHISSIFGFATDYLPLFLNSVVDCGCPQLLYIQTHAWKLISLFQPPGFQRRDLTDQAWAHVPDPWTDQLQPKGQGVLLENRVVPTGIPWNNEEEQQVFKEEGELGQQAFKGCAQQQKNTFS